MFVDEGAESQAVPEGRGHVGDGHIPVALDLDPAPLLQRLHGGHPEAPQPEVNRVGAQQRRWRLPELPPPSARTHSHWAQQLRPQCVSVCLSVCVCVCVYARGQGDTDTLRVCHLFSNGKSDVTPAEGRL